MFLFLPLLAGCLIGFVKRGNLWNLSSLKLKLVWMLPVAYIIQYFSIYRFQGYIYEVFIVISYLMLVLFCFQNRSVAGIKYALVGVISNFLVMAENRLRMPAYLPSVSKIDPNSVKLLEEGLIGKSVAMSSNTSLNFLGDIFTIHIGKGGLISIGDILIGIGIMVLIQYAMCSERTTSSNENTEQH